MFAQLLQKKIQKTIETSKLQVSPMCHRKKPENYRDLKVTLVFPSFIKKHQKTIETSKL